MHLQWYSSLKMQYGALPLISTYNVKLSEYRSCEIKQYYLGIKRVRVWTEVVFLPPVALPRLRLQLRVQ